MVSLWRTPASWLLSRWFYHILYIPIFSPWWTIYPDFSWHTYYKEAFLLNCHPLKTYTSFAIWSKTPSEMSILSPCRKYYRNLIFKLNLYLVQFIKIIHVFNFTILLITFAESKNALWNYHLRFFKFWYLYLYVLTPIAWTVSTFGAKVPGKI